MASPRLPAEWEPQSGVILCWPHAKSDWADMLDRVEPCVAEIATAISRFERVLMVAHDASHVRERLTAAGAVMERVRLIEIPSNDTWARDFGPITVLKGNTPELLDFTFNGWGEKFPAELDNRVSRRLHDAGVLGNHPMRSIEMVLEGGSIDSDGKGTILTTAACLLSPNRNPQLSKDGVEAALRENLGAERILWLHHGRLAGDDTDSHIDILARFAPGDTIIHMQCDDRGDPHYEEMTAMVDELAALTAREGNPYRLVALPWPKGKRNRLGEPVAPSYANFLVIDGAVLVPVYNDDMDSAAVAAVAGCFPGREAVAIPCSPLIEQGGSLHCMSMQLPAGVL
jgi:agmatine deiminase